MGRDCKRRKREKKVAMAKDDSHASERWIARRDRTSESRMRLFCLPHAGSGTAAYNSWRRGLPRDVELCPILLPGRESRIAEDACTDCYALVEELAEAMAGWMDKPYAIFGHSMGALLAYELAMALRERYTREPEALFLSGRIAAHLDLPGRPIHALETPEFLAELNERYEGLPRELLEDPEMLAMYLPILRADIALIEGYRPRDRSPLACPMIVLGGTTDRSIRSESLAAWSRHTTGPFQVKRMTGGHFYLWQQSRAALLGELSTQLEELAR